jgi:hypothetical protein
MTDWRWASKYAKIENGLVPPRPIGQGTEEEKSIVAMTMVRDMKTYRHLPVVTFLSLGAICALAAPAAAQDFLTSVPMKNALATLGIIAPDRDPIEYHERAPLVVPKTMDLPQPIAGGAAERNTDWPVDPDVAKKAKEKAENLEPVTGQHSTRMPDNPKLDISAMLGLRSSTPPIQPAGPTPQSPNESGYIPNGVLRAQGQQFVAQQMPDKEDEIKPGYEPRRRYLTDPPAGYRRPSDKAAFKKQYGPPQKKNTDDGNGMQFRREQALRQQGNYDPDNQ